MNVYILVSSCDWQAGYDIVNVYATKDAAQAAYNNLNKNSDEDEYPYSVITKEVIT